MRQMSCLKIKHKASENEEHTTPNLNPTWSNYRLSLVWERKLLFLHDKVKREPWI